MTPILRTLLIDDNPDDALLVERALKSGGLQVESLRVDTPGTLEQALTDSTWDIVISDFCMPHFSGLEALRQLQKTGLDIPFILVSGTIGEETAVIAMKSGVHDYVMKHNLARLAPAVERELRDAADRRARRSAEEQLMHAERMRTVGELTASLIHDLKNLYNR